MAVTLVQSVNGTNSFGGTSNTATLPNTTTGNILCVGVIWLCGTGNIQPVLSTVSDTGTNIFTIVAASLANLDNQGGATLTTYPNGATAHYGRIACQFAYCVGITGKTSHVVTATVNAGSGADSVFVSMWELTPGQFDQDSIGTGNSASMSCASLTPSAAGAFAIAQTMLDDGVGAGSGFTAGSGWTRDLNTGGGSGEEGTEHIAQATAAALTGNMTHTHSGGWASNQIIFVPAGGAGVALAGTSRTGSRSTGTLTVAVPLAGTSKTGSSSTGVLFVLSQSFQGTSSTGSQSTGTLTVTIPLAGASKTGSRSTGTLSTSTTFNGTSRTGSRSTGTLTVKIPLAGTSRSGSRSTGTLTVKVPFAGSASKTGSSSSGTFSVVNQIGLAGTSRTGSRSTGTLTVRVPLGGGVSTTGSRSTGTLTVHVALTGISRTGSLSTGRLSSGVHINFAGTSRTGSLSTGFLTANPPATIAYAYAADSPVTYAYTGDSA